MEVNTQELTKKTTCKEVPIIFGFCCTCAISMHIKFNTFCSLLTSSIKRNRKIGVSHRSNKDRNHIIPFEWICIHIAFIKNRDRNLCLMLPVTNVTWLIQSCFMIIRKVVNCFLENDKFLVMKIIHNFTDLSIVGVIQI